MTVTSFTSLSLLSTQGGANTMMMTLALLAMVYFFFMRPQQSRDKKINQMRANLEVGDEVITKGASSVASAPSVRTRWSSRLPRTALVSALPAGLWRSAPTTKPSKMGISACTCFISYSKAL